MSHLRRAFEKLEPSYRDCHGLYDNTLTTIKEKDGIFNNITLSMIKDQINDSSRYTLKEVLQKRIDNLKPSADLCSDIPRANICQQTNDDTDSAHIPSSSDSLGLSHDASGGSFDYSSDVMHSLEVQNPPAMVNSSANREECSANTEECRELRVLVAGDANTGKTSVLNLLMGDEYLPAYPDKCTAIPCEIHNSDSQLAQVYFANNTDVSEIELHDDKYHQNWETVSTLVQHARYQGRWVSKLKIFWPMRLLQDAVSNECGLDSVIDPEETVPMKYAGDELHETEVKTVISQKALPIVFLDLPGIWKDNENMEKVLDNVPNFHHFIIVIDISAPTSDTLKPLLQEIGGKIERYGIDFNPESALFLLNRSDIFRQNPLRKSIEQSTLEIIQQKWPVVSASQLYRMSCTDTKRESIDAFKEKIWNFLEVANRLNIEEHCLWLTNLLEVIESLCCLGVNWLPYDQSLREIKRLAEDDDVALAMEIDTWEDRTSPFYGEILKEAEGCKQKLERHLELGIGEDNNDIDRKIRSLINSHTTESIYEEFRSNIGCILKKHRQDLRTKIKLVEHLEQTYQSAVGLNDAVLVLGTLMSIPLAPLIFLGCGLVDEWRLMSSDPRKRKILQRSQLFLQKADEIVKKEIEFLISQRNIRQDIKSITPISNGEQAGLVSTIEGELKNIWEIYVGCVLTHNFCQDEVSNTIVDEVLYEGNTTVDLIKLKLDTSAVETVVARKVIRSRVMTRHAGRQPLVASLPQNMNIYRELVIMRSLSKKGNDNFVMFHGSASWIDGREHVLAVIMERCDSDLNDVIKNLNILRLREEWEETNGRKRLKYALGAAKGLAFVHSNDFIHRDVKPHNYLVQFGRNGQHTVKISDVGHARRLAMVKTEGFLKRGTVLYYAPEIINPPGDVHTKMSDMYSFGLVLWEMWYCRNITCRPGVPPALKPTPTGAFGRVLRCCLDTKPDRRPTSMEVVNALSTELQNV